MMYLRSKRFERTDPSIFRETAEIASRIPNGLAIYAVQIALCCLLVEFTIICASVKSGAQEIAPPSIAERRQAVVGKNATKGAGPTPSAIEFEDTIKVSKIKFTLRNSVSPQKYSIETMMGGVAVFDYNNDGLLDIFFTNGAEIPSLVKTNPDYYNRLFRNNGDGTFTDVTKKAGVSGRIPGYGKPWAVTAGWIDYDNDGRLDLFVVNYLNYDIKTATLCHIQEYPAYCSPDGFQGTPNILYHNNGDGTFTDVSAQSHISKYVGKGMGVAFADYDGDGFADIFVSNDTFPNFLLHNNGDGTFTDVALEAGVAFTGNGKTVAGMGADFRDLDNDGLPDLVVSDMLNDTFLLFRNLGKRSLFDDWGER